MAYLPACKNETGPDARWLARVESESVGRLGNTRRWGRQNWKWEKERRRAASLEVESGENDGGQRILKWGGWAMENC